MKWTKSFSFCKGMTYLEKEEIEQSTEDELIKHLESDNLSVNSGQNVVTELLKRLVKGYKVLR